MQLEKIEWEDIFLYWQSICEHRFPSLLDTITPYYVNLTKETVDIFSYEWVSAESFIRETDIVIRNPDIYGKYTIQKRKATRNTLQLLCETKNRKISAALWIYVFTRHLIDGDAVSGENFALCQSVCYSASIYLKDKINIQMLSERRLLPEYYISDYFFRNCKIESFEPFIELAMVNAQMTMKCYKPVIYKTV